MNSYHGTGNRYYEHGDIFILALKAHCKVYQDQIEGFVLSGTCFVVFYLYGTNAKVTLQKFSYFVEHFRSLTKIERSRSV